MHRPGPRRRQLLLGGAVAALIALTGCSPGGSEGSSTRSAADPGSSRDSGSSQSSAADGSRPAARAPVSAQAVVRTGSIALTDRDLARTITRVQAVLGAVGGTVATARTRHDDSGRVTRSTLTVRVPVARFGAAMDRLEGLARLRSSTESAQDITTGVIDVDERVQTLSTSLDRLQRFQRSARDVRDLIRFEDQITARQSELQSLQAQQTYLADRASLSTITLQLSLPTTRATAPGALDDAGFGAGLAGGWRALTGLVVVLLTVLGAALPFVVGVAVLAGPAALLLRARRRRRVAPDAR